MHKKITSIILCIFIIHIFNSCIHNETLKFNIDLEFDENKKTLILFDTKEGCSKTNFNINELFYEEYQYERCNVFIISNYIEYENIKKYFELEFFNTINEEYFNENNLIILLFTLNDNDYLKEGKILKSENNKYIFEIETKYNLLTLPFANKCIYNKLIILEIGKI